MRMLLSTNALEAHTLLVYDNNNTNKNKREEVVVLFISKYTTLNATCELRFSCHFEKVEMEKR